MRVCDDYVISENCFPLIRANAEEIEEDRHHQLQYCWTICSGTTMRVIYIKSELLRVPLTKVSPYIKE